MNTKLVKILALSAMVLSLGACGKKPGSSSEQAAPVKGIEEVLEINADGNFALEGQRVTVEDLSIAGKYGNSFIATTALGETVTTLRGLQIDVKEQPALEGSGWGCLINATGKVANVEGRAVLQDAEVTIVSERKYDDNGKKIEGTGGSLYYWGDFSRAAFDQYLGRKMSGIMLEGTFQIASKPGTVTGSAADSFQVVFPGEYADTEDPENVSLITVQIPAGINEAGVKGINDYFAEKEVGEFVLMTALAQYDLTNNGGMGLLVESFMGQQLTDPDEDPVIFTEWADAADSVQYLYRDELPDMSNEKVFTFAAKSYEDYALTDLYTDPSWILIPEDDQEHAILSAFDFLCKPADVEAVYAEAKADLVAEGFELVKEDADEGYAQYKLVDEDVVIAMAQVYYTEAQVSMEYIAHDNTYEFDALSEGLAAYESYASAILSAIAEEEVAFATGLIGLEPFASYLTEKGTVGDFSGATYYIGKYYAKYGLISDFSFETEVEYTAGENALTDKTFLENIVNVLGQLGFEEKIFGLFNLNGYFNATTNEFVMVSVKDAVLSLEVILLDADSAKQIKPPYKSDADLIAAVDEVISGYHAIESVADYFPAHATLPASFTVGEAEVVGWDMAEYDDFLNYLMAYFELYLTYPEGTDLQAVVAGLTASFKALGYTDHAHPYLGFEAAGDWAGLGNETTGEWVSFEIDAEENTICITYNTCGYIVSALDWFENREA